MKHKLYVCYILLISWVWLNFTPTRKVCPPSPLPPWGRGGRGMVVCCPLTGAKFMLGQVLEMITVRHLDRRKLAPPAPLLSLVCLHYLGTNVKTDCLMSPKSNFNIKLINSIFSMCISIFKWIRGISNSSLNRRFQCSLSIDLPQRRLIPWRSKFVERNSKNVSNFEQNFRKEVNKRSGN